MIYDWYLIFNLTAFEALNLVSKVYTADYEDLGQVDILVTKGNYVSMQYDDVFLPIQMSDENPFVFDNYAVWIDTETNNVYLGINEREAEE